MYLVVIKPLSVVPHGKLMGNRKIRTARWLKNLKEKTLTFIFIGAIEDYQQSPSKRT